MSLPSAIVLLSNGTEEMEAVICLDILTRAGIKVISCSLDEQTLVTCSRGVKLVADTYLDDLLSKGGDDLLSKGGALDYNALVLPGGMEGARAFASDQRVQKLLKEFDEQKKLLAVICASPVALAAGQIGKGKRITSHPCVKDEIKSLYEYSEERVVLDGHLLTSRGFY